MCVASAAAWALAAGFAAPPASAETGRLSIIEENDGLLPDAHDRNYTQGVLFTYLSPQLTAPHFANSLFDTIGTVAPVFVSGPDVKRRFSAVIGQSIFTPTDYHLITPNPNDRPFAGWLYSGGSLLQVTGGRTLENVELLVGVVGPAAMGKQIQQWFHSWAGFNNANLDQSWSHQLRNEPGFMLTYERKVKAWQGSFMGIEAEAIPEAGITLGNVMTAVQAGAMVRFGQNLGVDFGPNHIRPSQSGTAWFDEARLTQPFGWYFYAGAVGRAVAHNIFLDGNSFSSGPSVKRNIFVGDLTLGASLFWNDWAKLDISVTERTQEFTAQRAPDHYGRVALSVKF